MTSQPVPSKSGAVLPKPLIASQKTKLINQSEIPNFQLGSFKMTPLGQKICLNMIVKNESPVIRRCLDSVRPLIDSWVIVDTGSTDGTQDIIRDYLHDLPGELHERPWRDFAHNRNEALDLARKKGDYTLIIDADDTLEIAPNAAIPVLTEDHYQVVIHHGGILYWRTQLVRDTLPWRWEGVLHEYLTCDGAGAPGQISGIRLRLNEDGARRRDTLTYHRDAAVFEAALLTETTPFLLARYRFYLAQSYRDCNEHEKALENYLARAELGFWQEEVFISLYQAARLKQELGHPDQEIIDAYLRAADAAPGRAEALHGASRFCRLKGRYEEGYQFAKRGLQISMPANGLFVEPWIYETGLLDEFAINAYWSGHMRDCLDACLKLLATGKLSPDTVRRITENARFASEKLRGDWNLGTLGAENFEQQHALSPDRKLRSRLGKAPRVLIAILAKQKEEFLPLYLECIEALDYPKSSIVLYIRTNNNLDGTERILSQWVERVGDLYAGVEYDAEDVETPVEQFGAHEWNAVRFNVLGHIRNISLRRAVEHKCDFYFVADVDNFIRPCTLRNLVSLDLPIVAPFLRTLAPGDPYSNFHAEIDNNGYYQRCDQYKWILNRWVRGVIEMPVVHCTYLIRSDVVESLNYVDGTNRYEYVVFSDSARRQDVTQYLDNRQVYGYITFSKGHDLHIDNSVDLAKTLLADVAPPAPAQLFPELPPMRVINLDSSVERLQKFRDRNKHLPNIIRYPAVNGRELDREALVAQGVITQDVPYGAGTLGCAMSHIRLWQEVLETGRSLTIFEDDIVISRQFEKRAREVFASVGPDWEMIQWGHIINPSFSWVDIGLSKIRLHCYDSRRYEQSGGWRDFQEQDFVTAPLKLLHSFGAQGYSVSPEGARKMLEYCLPLRNRMIDFPEANVVTPDLGIDIALCGVYPQMRAFTCIPPLLIHYNNQQSDRIELEIKKEKDVQRREDALCC
jgi:GR25 family glycosyltransferase involved in LPS biosynthesis/glycosyltransferase involved in cell wall biosynthesis